jgi:alkanesulfonate monooxygenase SsuD/methylene tetrahydromethanopterin reductase-like flavin-dependent oxidoreductase (luciferase family)
MDTAMKTGVGIDRQLGLSREQECDLAREAARLGFESLWTPGRIGGMSIFQICRDWWEASGLSVGTSVIPFPGWSVPTLASESASLSVVTDGKFSLGIGLGAYPSQALIRQLGLPSVAPLTYTREYVTSLRALMKGDTVDLDGKGVQLRGVNLGLTAPKVPVYLAAMGEQMLRVSGQYADGVTPNWCSTEQVAWMRTYVEQGARKAGRDPSEVPFALYIRVCIDEDEHAARRTFATNMLGYAMARPGQPKDRGYRAHFGRMGFHNVLTDLEERREAGTPVSELADLVPPELLLKVGYFGKAAGAAEAMRRLSAGLEEAMVRLITVRKGDLAACTAAIQACRPSEWKAR